MSQAPRRLGSLYICYLSLEDPLVHTQVVAYLRGLAAAGHRIHLLTYETSRLTRERRRRLRAEMAAQGIAWHGLRYHKRPSLPATVYDTLLGAVAAAALVIRHRLDVIHARSHVPAAMALIALRLPGRAPALIFDIRGLWAEEYVDAGRWRQGSLPFRLTKAVERAAIARAAGIVVLTERIRRQLFGESPPANVWVIPCCADIARLEAAPGARDAMRAQLRLGDSPVMVYVGKFGGWYMAAEMAALFATARDAIPGLRFLILTQGDRDEIRSELARFGAEAGDYTIASVQPDDLGGYLAGSDFGICFIRPSPSKASSSPTKVGEYLAAGLPVVATAGVGDLDQLITPEIGALVAAHDFASHEEAARHVARLLENSETPDRCRAVAARELSLDEVGVPRYRELYDRVALLLKIAPHRSF